MYYKLISSNKEINYYETYEDLIDDLAHHGWYGHRRADGEVVQNLVRNFNQLELIRWTEYSFIIQPVYLVQTYSGDIVNPDKIIQDVHTLQNKRWREYHSRYANIFRKAPIPHVSNGRWHFMCRYKTPKTAHDMREAEKSVHIAKESDYKVKIKNNHKFYDVDPWDDHLREISRCWKKYRKHQYKD